MKFKITLNLFYTFLIVAVAGAQLDAQNMTCGTVVTPEQKQQELARNSDPAHVQFVPNKCFGKTLSVTVHIIADSLGNYGTTLGAIQAAIQTLNNNFAPICLSFQVCKYDSIRNFKYNRFVKPWEEEELRTLYYVPNTINLYFASEVQVTPGSNVAGYAYFPGGPDFIIISKASIGSPKTISHEFGHFFGLYHTFETQFGVSLANGSNCAGTGDLICDTPADPGLSNFPPPSCQLNPPTKDATGEWYVPSIGNIMSYYSDACNCGFTTQQYNKMAANYLSSRFYLW